MLKYCPSTKELNKLKKHLARNGIDYRLIDHSFESRLEKHFGYQLQIPTDEKLLSVLFVARWNKKQEYWDDVSEGASGGWLEVWNGDPEKEPVGWMSATEVLYWIKGEMK